ncbi:MAG: metal homeostatis protein bsd2 [Benjaminiella poitrasii]|nr:MAG: metal homeostatis protein bsd2 [Benjaminiella poitrasii]
MPNNHRYEQVPHAEQEYAESLDSRPIVAQQRSDLEDTFNIHDEQEDEHMMETEYHQLLPAHMSTAESQITNNVQPVVHSNDGVFSNMSAKPETDKVEELPPTYEEAAADATPPYWQTTVIAPVGMGDMILVEGLPVGNLFSFLWNMMVSASFQLVGFMLTYLLHTTHAAKDGARAGLGISLIQYGFYVRSRGTLDEDFDYDGEGHETVGQDAAQADLVAYIMMFIGWFIILRAVSDYMRARKMEKIITSEPTSEPTSDPDNMV